MGQLRDRVVALCAEHGLDDAQADALTLLLELLAADEHAATTVRDPGRALDVHLRDSLTGLRLPVVREAGTLVDLGAGAGFPGLPLAVALPDARITLLDAVGRKVEQVRGIGERLQLANAVAVHARAEELAAREDVGADVVVARAVADLGVLAEWAAPLLREGGALVAWKGRRDQAEEARGTAAAGLLGLDVEEVLPVPPWPGADDRHLHVLRKVGPTPARFPRRPGMARKRPLAP